MTEPVSSFDAFPAGDGVLVRMTDRLAADVEQVLDELLRLLEEQRVPPNIKSGFWRRASAEKVLRRMFHDATRSKAEADAFWERHRDVLTDPEPARRVRTRCSEPTPWVLGFDEVDDWFVAFAQLRALYLLKPGATVAGAQGYSAVQHALVAALDPRAATGWPG